MDRLTRTERLPLYNQFKILNQLNPDEDHYHECCEILQHGWVAEYDTVFESIFRNELSLERTDYILDVLQRDEQLSQAYEKLTDASGIDPKAIRFHGFDTNHEIDLIAYAEYLRDRKGWAQFLKDLSLGVHRNTEERYRRMIQR